MTKPVTASERARAIAREHPDWTPSEIAAEIRRVTRRPCSRQLVEQALSSVGKPGRPLRSVTLPVRAPHALLPYLDILVRDGGYQSRAEAALTFLEDGLVPKGERAEYEAAKTAEESRRND